MIWFFITGPGITGLLVATTQAAPTSINKINAGVLGFI
jgi:hypothetical protein